MYENSVKLLGNLASDVTLAFITAGVPVAKFRFAANRKYSVGEGQNREVRQKTLFIDVEVWGKQAELCNKHLHSGSRVYLSGEIDLDQWEDRETKDKRSKHKITIDWRRGGSVQILDWEKGEGADGAEEDHGSEPEPEPAPRGRSKNSRRPAGARA